MTVIISLYSGAQLTQKGSADSPEFGYAVRTRGPSGRFVPGQWCKIGVFRTDRILQSFQLVRSA